MARRHGRAQREERHASADHAAGAPRRPYRCAADGGARRPWRRLGHRHQLPTIDGRGTARRPAAAAALEQLAASALVMPHDGDRWRFAHALIHDAAYAGLLASRRRQSSTARLADRLERGPEREHAEPDRGASGGRRRRRRAIPLLARQRPSALALGAAAEAAAFWRQAADSRPTRSRGSRDDRARAARRIAFDSQRSGRRAGANAGRGPSRRRRGSGLLACSVRLPAAPSRSGRRPRAGPTEPAASHSLSRSRASRAGA